MSGRQSKPGYFTWTQTHGRHNVQIPAVPIPEHVSVRLKVLAIAISELRHTMAHLPAQEAANRETHQQSCLRYAAERVRIVENEVPLFATLDKAIGKFNNARRAHGQIQNQRLEGNSRQSWFLVDRHLLDAAKTRLHAHEEYVELLIKAGQLINARAAAERIIQLRGSLRVCRFVGEDQAPCDDYVQGNTQGLIDNLEQLVYIEDNLGNDGRATLLRQRVAKLTNELPTTAA